jgi:hypothetical protein
MPPYESTVGSSDLELGQDYFGSIVARVEQDVSTDVNDDDVEIYVVKRKVTLKNGVIMNEKYHRKKSLGEIKSRKYGLQKDERRKSKKSTRDHDEKKKKRTPKKNRSLPSGPPKRCKDATKNTKERRSKSSSNGMDGKEPWYNFDEIETPEPPPLLPTSSDVGKLELEKIWQEKIPDVAIVYPRNDAPDRQDEDREIIIAKGTWKFPNDKPKTEGSDSWVP